MTKEIEKYIEAINNVGTKTWELLCHNKNKIHIDNPNVKRFDLFMKLLIKLKKGERK